MSAAPLTLGLIGFGAATLAFVAVLLLVLASHPGTRQSYCLIGALLMSAIWSGVTSFALFTNRSALIWLPTLDALYLFGWIVFGTSVLVGSRSDRRPRRIAFSLILAASLCVLVVLALELIPAARALAPGSRTQMLALLLLPLFGLLTLEQVTRNADFENRRVVRPLTIGIGLIFVLEVFCYSQAFVFPGIDAFAWQLRGIGNAVAAPFVLVAIKRQRDWEQELFLSRQVVFHTASLVAAGVYLVMLGLVGSLMGPFDRTLRAWLQLGFLAVGGIVFVYALFSTALRRRFRVFIAKHFYRNRYDYRREWLRFIETLAGVGGQASITERGVKALAEIVESDRGELWWADEPGTNFEACGAWGMPVPVTSLGVDSALINFLRGTNWVIDTDEYVSNPELYAHAFESAPYIFETPSIYVPLNLEGQLRGVVRLDRRPDLEPLGFESHDLLKTAGMQVAVFLNQERIQARLAETRQFEAFSRLTTFLMHDLKNMISQQELVVGNARRFKHKPEFVDDAIRTIEESVKRMRRVLERLQSHGAGETSSVIDLGKLIAEVVNGCSDRHPVPEPGALPAGIYVTFNKEKLAMALTHAIRNAQDATPPDGSIRLETGADGDAVSIEIVDTGVGMTAEFIRDRLFRPFDSTKGAQGMGIGAYQTRETIRAGGGELEVQSVPGKGTIVRMRVPRAVPIAVETRAIGETS